jgi:hypothetical protein
MLGSPKMKKIVAPASSVASERRSALFCSLSTRQAQVTGPREAAATSTRW